MDAQRKLRTIKTICRLGAIVDAFWVLALLWPGLFTRLTGNVYPDEDLAIRLIGAVAASLMAGWTVLLFWTARKPIERRAVMLFTAIPVVMGLFCLTMAGYVARESSTEWILLKLAGLFAAMLWAYFAAISLDQERRNEISK